MLIPLIPHIGLSQRNKERSGTSLPAYPCELVFFTSCSINEQNSLVWLPLHFEIFGNICIATVCFPACDVINFKISLFFLMRLSFRMTKNSRQRVKGAKKSYFTHYLYVSLFCLMRVKTSLNFLPNLLER